MIKHYFWIYLNSQKKREYLWWWRMIWHMHMLLPWCLSGPGEPCSRHYWVWCWWCWAPARWRTGRPWGRPGPRSLPGSRPLQAHTHSRAWGQTLAEQHAEPVCVLNLTVDIVDGESVGEVGHVGLLSEGGFLLRGLLGASIVETLNKHFGNIFGFEQWNLLSTEHQILSAILVTG